MLKRLLKNDYAFAMILRIICIILGFVYTILLSRYLGADLRGEYSIVQNYANIIAIFIGFGIYQAYPYFKRKILDKNEQKKLYQNIVSNVLGIFILYTIISIILIILLPVDLRIKVTLAIIPATYLYKQLNYIILIEYPRECNKLDVVLAVIDIILVILLMIFSTSNLFYCFLFLIVDKMIYAFFPIKNLHINLIKNKPKLDINIKKYIKYGFIPMLTIVLMNFNHKVDILMLSFFKNVTMAEIGVYSLGVMLAEKAWMLPDTLTNMLQSKLAGGKREDEVSKISRVSFCVTALCLILVAIVGKPLIIFAYGNQYADAYNITMIILLGVLGMIFYKVVYAYNVVVGKRKLNFVLLASSVLLNIVLNFFFINAFGVIGAGYASLISFVVCGISFLISFTYCTKIKFLDMIILHREDIRLVKDIFLQKKKKR